VPAQELAPGNTLIDNFGASVAIAFATTGPAIAVGAPRDDGQRGRVYVYTPYATGFGHLLPLGLSQTLSHPSGTAVAGDWLGETLAAVRVKGNAGDTLVVGVPRRDSGGKTDSGAYVRFNASASGSTPYPAQGTIVDNPAPAAGARFGVSFATYGEYDPITGADVDRQVVVGAEGATGGAGGFWIRNGQGGFDPFTQETASPEH
jgi:hypothetical protein